MKKKVSEYKRRVSSTALLFQMGLLHRQSAVRIEREILTEEWGAKHNPASARCWSYSHMQSSHSLLSAFQSAVFCELKQKIVILENFCIKVVDWTRKTPSLIANVKSNLAASGLERRWLQSNPTTKIESFLDIRREKIGAENNPLEIRWESGSHLHSCLGLRKDFSSHDALGPRPYNCILIESYRFFEIASASIQSRKAEKLNKHVSGSDLCQVSIDNYPEGFTSTKRNLKQPMDAVRSHEFVFQGLYRSD